MSWIFKCLECGDCCKNLRSTKKMGLLLMPHEIDFFHRDQVELCLGKGKSPNHPTFVIWAFQLIDDTCPHLLENQCKIYENRPECCRAYPYRMRSKTAAGKFIMNLAPECRALIKAIDSKSYREGTEGLSSYESEIAKQIGFWMMRFKKWKKRDDTPWVYNLEKKEWEVFK